jgi:hypothetical protein
MDRAADAMERSRLLEPIQGERNNKEGRAGPAHKIQKSIVFHLFHPSTLPHVAAPFNPVPKGLLTPVRAMTPPNPCDRDQGAVSGNDHRGGVHCILPHWPAPGMSSPSSANFRCRAATS